ncbi:tetratricopeptide repeat protein [bacterium]|nr:tetratricopeptide repeat protein [bacterium]
MSENAFDESVCKDTTFDNIDEEKIRWFLGVASNKRKYPLNIDTSVKDTLIHLNLLNSDKLTNAAILLFGKTPSRHLLQAEIKCIQFAGTQVEKPFSSYQIYNGNLFEQIDKAVAFVLDSIKFPLIQQEHTAQVKRQHEIPVFVIQEAIVNALIHRDYNNTGAVQVMVFIDRIEISNPGGLTNHLTIEKLKKPHTSYPTNPLIAQVVYLADYAQKAGSGTIEMVKQCRAGRIPEPEFISTRHEFKAIIARDIYTQSALNKLELNERQRKAIQYVKEKGKITNKEYREMFSITDRTALYDLTGLCSKRVFERLGKTGRSTVYALTRNKPEKPEIQQEAQVNDSQNVIVQTGRDVHIVSLSLPLSLHNQPPPEPNFVGRVEMLETVTEWYKNSEVRIGVLIGWGGVGKSALVRKWFDDLEKNNIHPDGIFWWGFYRNAHLERFLDSLLEYLTRGRIDLSQIRGTWEKVKGINELILEGEYLIILDGLEEMQKGEASGEEFGSLTHQELSEILKFLADAKGKGLCLITTRYPLKDIENYEGSTYQKIGVERLELEDARGLFEKVGVKGEQEEMDQVIEEYDGHALSLTLLSRYLVSDFGGDIKKVGEIPAFHSDEEAGEKAHRILLWYAKQLTEEQRVFMKIFSLFRRTVAEKGFEGVFRAKMETEMNQPLRDMSTFSFNRMKDNLCARRLISKGQDDYTTHPLIKAYFESIFEEEDKKLCHKYIYGYIGSYAPGRPETLEEMQPLFEQVYHGCKAEMYQEAYWDVYWQKVERREEGFLIWKLGAWETNLSLVQNFFPNGDFQKEPLVPKIGDKSYLIIEAGISMISLGRLKEAEGLCKRVIEILISQRDWKNASLVYQNLALLQILTGNLLEAKKSSEEATRLSRKARDVREECYSTTYLAYTLFLLGEMDKASDEFKKAGELERKNDPSKRYLYSRRGIQYADLLLAQGKIQKALDVTQENLRRCKDQNWIDAINLCHRSLASIYRHLEDFQKAEANAMAAIEGARKTGVQDIEAESLIELARIRLDQGQYPEAESILNQALRICQRCGYRLYEIDAELILARLYLAQNNTSQAKSFAQSASSKATRMHYHRPKTEAARLLEKIEELCK